MTQYGDPVGVVDSDQSCEPDPHMSLAGQHGWSFFPMRDDRAIQPQRLLDVDTQSGQIVLKDADGNVRWSFVVRHGDTYRYVTSADHRGASVHLDVVVSGRVAGDSEPDSYQLSAIDVLKAAHEGREYLEL